MGPNGAYLGGCLLRICHATALLTRARAREGRAVRSTGRIGYLRSRILAYLEVSKYTILGCSETPNNGSIWTSYGGYPVHTPHIEGTCGDLPPWVDHRIPVPLHIRLIWSPEGPIIHVNITYLSMSQYAQIGRYQGISLNAICTLMYKLVTIMPEHEITTLSILSQMS